MTVSTQVSRNEYTGNGATTQYDFTFRILDKSHLLVQTLDTSESIVTLTLGTDYTVTGVNRYNGGKVVLTSALPAGYKISIERSTPVTQEASIRNQGGFFPEIHEDAFDKLTMLVQQAYGWWSGLSLRKPSWLANYYDALNNRIRNLRDPSQAQDAATKKYVDGQIIDNTNAWKAGDAVLDQKIDENFRRTIRVPEIDVDMVPAIPSRKNSLFGWNSSGKPVPIFSTTETADLAIKLASNESGLGGSLVGLDPGGTVQDAITWVNLEAFGGGVDVDDNGPAFRKIAELAITNDVTPYIRFRGRTYQVKTKVVFERAVIFEGAGALHGSLLADTIHESDKIQRCSTLIKDAREYDTSDFLFEFKDGERPVLGVAFRGVEFVGASVNDAPEKYNTCGVFIDISGWVTSSSNLLVRDFGLTGLKVNHNDGVWNNTSVLRCGGKLGSTVYYGLDLKREDGSGTFTNQHKFNNPHIEHCRYAIRCSGYMNLFHGGHLELNDNSFIPDGDSHPVVLFEQLTYPVTFDKMTFISPSTLRYLDGYAPTTDPAQLAANLAALPAFFGGVAGSVIDPTSDTVKAFIRFDGCDMTNSRKPVKWFDIPDVRILIDGCHITRAATWSSALKLGHNSKITNTLIQMGVVSGDTSAYAALVNNVWSVPVAGYGHISGDNVEFIGGNAAYACFSAAGGGGSARTRLTNILRGDYGYTIGTVIGDYLNGYVSSWNGIRIQSDDGQTMSMLPMTASRHLRAVTLSVQ